MAGRASAPPSYAWVRQIAPCSHGEAGTIADPEGRLGLHRSLDIVGQAAVAVGAAHRVGLVHRDVKPANLLVGPANLLVGREGTVK